MYELKVWDETDESVVIPKTISGDKFLAFLELCFQEATYFSLKKAIWTDATNTAVQKKIEPYLIREIETLNWFGYGISLAPIEYQRKMNIYLYKADRAAKDILGKYFSDIFLRYYNNGILSDSNQTLEDLCFFTKEKLFVGTVSHENILEVFPPSNEFEKNLKMFGEWDYNYKDPMILP